MSICSKLSEYCFGGQAWKPLPKDDTPLLPLDSKDVQAIAGRQIREVNYRRMRLGALGCFVASGLCLATQAYVPCIVFAGAGYTGTAVSEYMRARAIFSRKSHVE